jgi:biotin-(acetyl-CoA carboxylase) ligase
MQNGTLTQAEAVAIDDVGRLEVRLDSGETLMLSSGEVSIVM